MSRESQHLNSNSNARSSVKSLRLLAHKTLRSSRKLFSSSDPQLKLAAENPRFKHRSQKKNTSPRHIQTVRTMTSTGTPRSKSSDKMQIQQMKSMGVPADEQVKMVLNAKQKALRKKGEFLFGPSVAMRAHHSQRMKPSQTRMFRKLLPFGSNSKNVRIKPSQTPATQDVVDKRPVEKKSSGTPKSPEESGLILQALKNLVLFSKFKDVTLEILVDEMEEKRVTAGTVVCKQGDFGEEMFVVVEGDLEATREVDPEDSEKDQEISRNTPPLPLGSGNAFGELGMHFGSPRERTIKALTDCKLFVLTRAVFGGIVENEYLRKNELMMEALSKVKILDRLSNEQMGKMVEFVELVSFPAGKKIIEKGTLGGTFYMIISGFVECVVYEEEAEDPDQATLGRNSVGAMESDIFGDSQSILVVEEEFEKLDKTMKRTKVKKKTYELGKGLYFGERALIQHDLIRKADVIAKTDVELLAITYETFSQHLSGLTSAFEENIRRQALEEASIFDNLSGDEIVQLQKALKCESFKDGTYIITENTDNDKFYMVRDGEVEVRKSIDEKSTANQFELRTLKKDQYFGEGSLLFGKKANASVIAKGDVTCFVLSKNDFKKFIRDEKVTQLQDTFNERHRRNMQKHRQIKNEVLANVKLQDLKTITTLGSGCFGLVKLVKPNSMESFYALKILEKGTVVRNNQELNVLNEKRILLESDHPFIVRLYRTFKDKKYLYFLMEFIQGGEMFQFLHHERNGYLDNDTARFFVACVVDALDFLHSKKIVYRDLKPENLMIDLDGYAKVVDFGFAKKLIYRTFTLCGTAQYLAPEILFNKGYTRSVDFWTLGILIYELFTGTTPFKRRDRNELFRAIKHENRIKFNRRWRGADPAKELVCLLLHKHSKKRLGCAPEHRGFKEVKQHAWFAPIDFERLYYKEITPPWLPKVKNAGDFSHFEDYDDDDNPLTGKYDDRAGESEIWKEF